MRSVVRARVAQAIEDNITRPVFFAVVLPPLVLWDWWQRRKMEQQPKTLEEAVVWLKNQLGAECAQLMELSEKDFASIHHSVGRRVRNELKLWDDPHPPLWHYFVNELKIDHPDDMSGLIMTTLHRHLNGKPLDIEAQVCKYHEYWAAFAGRNRCTFVPRRSWLLLPLRRS